MPKKSSSSKRSSKRPSKRSSTSSSKRPAKRVSPSEAPSKLLFPDLESELATTRRMLERIPNGNDDWRPHTKSRTLGELATHVAQLPGFAIMMATRDEFDAMSQRPPEPRFANSTQRVKFFDDLTAQLRGILQQMTWDQARSMWTLRGGDRVFAKAPRATILRNVFFTHSAHHRAQLGVYLRLLEVSVPWSYGRSADEEPPLPI